MNVKMTRCFMAATALTAVCAHAAVNDVFDVRTVDELTNACWQATANANTIRIHPGVYDLTGMPMTPATRDADGAVTTSGTVLSFSSFGGALVGLGERPGDTVIRGGGEADSCRLLSLGKTCVVSNLTLTGGWVSGDGGSGGVASGPNGTFTDCIFSNNYARNFGGVFDGVKTVTRCRFVGNRAGSGGVLRPVTGGEKEPTLLRDCHFEGNVAAATQEKAGQNGGVAYYGCMWSNCVFVGNAAKVGGVFGSVFSHTNVVLDCRFERNTAENGAVAAFGALAAATNCTFVGNVSSEAGSNLLGLAPGAKDAYEVGAGGDLFACTIAANTGMPLVVGATLRSCTLRGNVGNRTNTNPLFLNCALYNSLVTENRGGAHDMSQIVGGDRATLANCTVASNAFCAVNYAVAGGTNAVNTVFAGNYLVDRATGAFVKRQDMNAKNLPAALTNCLWTVQAGAPDAASAVGCRLVTDRDLRFADAAAGDWSIGRRSVARNAGWSDAAYLEAVGETDLLGAPRVFAPDGGQIDVGCYECCIVPLGTLFLLR